MTNESKHTRGSGTTTLTDEETRHEGHDANRDPITGEPGAHPVGTGVGAVAGGAAGAAVGAAGGPVGTLVGGTVGAIVGSLAGHGVAEQVNPTVEDAFWRESYTTRDYVEPNRPYDDYQPAYRYGWESRASAPERRWDNELERDLERGWEGSRGASDLTWQQAQPATRDAWDRLGTTELGTGLGGDISASIGPVFVISQWREVWETSPYAGGDSTFEDFEPAYRYGWDARDRFSGRSWDPSLERDLESGWDKAKGRSRLTWERAQQAVRQAWDRLERKLPGDADRDGR